MNIFSPHSFHILVSLLFKHFFSIANLNILNSKEAPSEPCLRFIFSGWQQTQKENVLPAVSTK